MKGRLLETQHISFLPILAAESHSMFIVETNDARERGYSCIFRFSSRNIWMEVLSHDISVWNWRSNKGLADWFRFACFLSYRYPPPCMCCCLLSSILFLMESQYDEIETWLNLRCRTAVGSKPLWTQSPLDPFSPPHFPDLSLVQWWLMFNMWVRASAIWFPVKVLGSKDLAPLVSWGSSRGLCLVDEKFWDWQYAKSIGSRLWLQSFFYAQFRPSVDVYVPLFRPQLWPVDRSASESEVAGTVEAVEWVAVLLMSVDLDQDRLITRLYAANV